MDDLDDARLRLLGQIAVMRARLDAVEELLVSNPIGAVRRPEEEVNAIGNLTFQTGFLVGIATKYHDAILALPE